MARRRVPVKRLLAVFSNAGLVQINHMLINTIFDSLNFHLKPYARIISYNLFLDFVGGKKTSTSTRSARDAWSKAAKVSGGPGETWDCEIGWEILGLGIAQIKMKQ